MQEGKITAINNRMDETAPNSAFRHEHKSKSSGVRSVSDAYLRIRYANCAYSFGLGCSGTGVADLHVTSA